MSRFRELGYAGVDGFATGQTPDVHVRESDGKLKRDPQKPRKFLTAPDTTTKSVEWAIRLFLKPLLKRKARDRERVALMRNRKVFHCLLVGVSIIAVAGLLCPYSLRFMYDVSWMSIAAAEGSEAEKVCVVTDPELTEASGIAISRQHTNAVWIHNDSGDTARLFLVGLDGRTKAIFTVNGVEPMDWEDMCSFEAEGEKWLLIGDTGDNGRVRGKQAPLPQLILLKEPKLSALPETTNVRSAIDIEAFGFVEFTFPGGPADCECVAVDVKSREILLLSKTDPLNCRLFRLPLSLQPGRTTAKAEVVTSPGVPYATGMDISADGEQLVIVNMISGALIRRTESETWQQACRNPAAALTLPARRQGETVCFEQDGASLLLNSEGTNQPLWRMPLPK